MADFQSKLKKVNPLLYVYLESTNRVAVGVFVTGIYLKQPRQNASAQKLKAGILGSEVRSYVDAVRDGQRDTFVTGVSTNYIPEFDVFDLDRERMLMPGWRSILLLLVEKKLCSLDKAKRVFRCRSLGESTWDRLNFIQRLQWAKGDRPERKF